MLTIDKDRHEVMLDGKEIRLAPREYKILVALMDADGFVLSRDTLVKKISRGKNLPKDTRVIDQHIARMRRKFGNQSDPIRTVPTAGYRYVTDTR